MSLLFLSVFPTRVRILILFDVFCLVVFGSLFGLGSSQLRRVSRRRSNPLRIRSLMRRQLASLTKDSVINFSLSLSLSLNLFISFLSGDNFQGLETSNRSKQTGTDTHTQI